MKFAHRLSGDIRGVSPVIGVMLMIVVTVILAAAVASYANSFDTQERAPQTSLTAEASIQKGYISLEHLSGSTLDIRDIQIKIESGYPSQIGTVDMDNVTFIPGPNFLNPGDEIKINFTASDNYSSVLFSGQEISQSVELGEPFTITIIDSHSGQAIFSSEITLLP